MRIKTFKLFALSLFFISSAFYLQASGNGKNNDSLKSGKSHISSFYGLNFGITALKTSGPLNNWLVSKGLDPINSSEYNFGYSQVIFHKNWIYDLSCNFYSDLNHNNAPSLFNGSVGIGHKLFKTKYFDAYGAVDFGVNEIYFISNPTLTPEAGLSRNSDVYIQQDAFLVNPHILLYKQITPNLSAHPGFDSRLGVGIEAGFNGTLWTGKWKYQKDDDMLRTVKVSGIPNSSFSGFYVMGKIGWQFAR